MKSGILAAAVVFAVTTTGLRADFSYEQSTKITGGAMAAMMRVAGSISKQARMPAKSQVLVKGDRMAHLNGDTAQIIDIAAETFTDVNFAKKTYSVVTFAQMAEAMKKMAERMHQDPEADVEFKVDVKDTGATQAMQGLNTHELVMTLTSLFTDKKTGKQGEMKIVSDMWLTQEVKGYDEVRQFHQRMAQKMAIIPGGMGAGMMQPGMTKGMSELYKQAAKLEGVPVLQVIRIGDVPAGAGAAPSGEGQAPAAAPAPAPSASDAAASAITGRLGRLGGLGGFGRKKKPQPEEPKEPEQAPAAESAPAAPAAPGSLMEVTAELTAFSPAEVDGARLQVPSGFKQVESEMVKNLDK